MTAAEPAVKTATAYYEANIGSVKSIGDLVGNYRLLSYALNAYGLGDQINAKGLVTKVLEGESPTPRALPTLCRTRNGRRSPRLSISSTAAQLRLHRQARLRRRRAIMSNSSWRATRAARTWASSLRCISSASRRRSPTKMESSPIQTFCKWPPRSWGSRPRPRPICNRRRSPSSCPSPTCRTRPNSTS